MLADGSQGRAAVPSGASTGSHEAIELRDGGSAWGGKAVSRAVGHVGAEIAAALTGTAFASHREIDEALVALDGTPNKSRLGANAILGVSLAAARALSAHAGVPLWKWLSEAYPTVHQPQLPVPMLNIINGGEHANNQLDIQEFMVVPHGFGTFSEAMEASVHVYHTLRGILASKGMSTAVGDEGGFAPEINSDHEALALIAQAIGDAGYALGDQFGVALDVAATELYRDGAYRFAGTNTVYGVDELVEHYQSFLRVAPIVSIEDGMSEDDWDGWAQLTKALGSSMQLVGDDLFVTNSGRLAAGIEAGVANAMLVKVNQIGSLSETMDAMALAAENGYANVMSHRSGETEDTTIADLAVGSGCGQIKTGAPCRSDRVAKYNQLLRIESQMGSSAHYAQPFCMAAAGGAG